MPLTFAKNGEVLLIKKINGKDDVCRFLESLGFVAGERITIVSRLGCNFILNVKNTRVAIDKTMAGRIMI